MRVFAVMETGTGYYLNRSPQFLYSAPVLRIVQGPKESEDAFERRVALKVEKVLGQLVHVENLHGTN